MEICLDYLVLQKYPFEMEINPIVNRLFLFVTRSLTVCDNGDRPGRSCAGHRGTACSFQRGYRQFLAPLRVFDNGSGLRDLAARFHVERLELKEWVARFNLNDPRAEECLVYYETDEKRKLIFKILDRINARLTDAQDLLKYHARSDAPQKGFKIRSQFNKRHADAQGRSRLRQR